jgi:hypothetical protein
LAKRKVVHPADIVSGAWIEYSVAVRETTLGAAVVVPVWTASPLVLQAAKAATQPMSKITRVRTTIPRARVNDGDSAVRNREDVVRHDRFVCRRLLAFWAIAVSLRKDV